MTRRTTSRIPRTPGLWALIALCLFALPRLAAGAAPAPVQEPAAEELLASPREVMQTFVDSMLAYERHGGERNLERALTAFTGTVSAEAAGNLYQALNRVEYVDYGALAGAGDPDLADGRAYHTFGPPPDDQSALLAFEFERGEDGGWRIASSTVQRIDEMWERVADLPIIDDLPFLTRVQDRLRKSLPAGLQGKAFVLENWQWLGLALLALAAVILDRIARVVAGALLRRIARGGSAHLDADSVEAFGRPIGLWTGATVFGFLLPALDLEPQVAYPLDLAAAFAATVAGVWAAYRLVDVVCDYLASKAAGTETRFDDVLVPLLRRTLKLLVAIVGLVFLASKWTDDLWGVVAGLGVGSIAVAFAGRDTIENLFGTFTVLLDKPFELGDWIIVGSTEGSVEEVGFRSTRIRTFYNSVITVPNRVFVTAEVDNMGRRKYRRVKTMLSLTYDTPPEKVEAFCAGVRRVIETHPYTRKDYFHVYLNALSSSSLDVLLYAFLETPEWGTELREKHRLFADILRVAERLNVSFAFPTQTLHMARPEDLEHPDRPANDGDGDRLGTRVADEVVAETLAPWGGLGAMPPPVAANSDPHAQRGSEVEAGE